MTEIVVTLPLWILFFTAVCCGFFWNSPAVQKGISIVGSTLFLASAFLLTAIVYRQGIQSVQVGDWDAPFGITLVSDLFSAAMVLISAVIGFAIMIYALQDVSPERKANGFYPVFHLMLFGVCGAFLAGDVFNMYVWFEVMLVASFVLIVLGNTKAQLEGAVKYVTLNFIASGFFLTGVAIIYKTTGALNMAELALIMRESDATPAMSLAAVFFFICFGIKAAVFPLFFWLPASYHTPPVSVSGLMAGLLTKVGVYALIRFFTLIFVHDVSATHTFLLIIAGLTMFTGVLGAVIQNDFRKILSFHIISQIGYMIMGLALYTPLAIAGSIFYIIHHILVKTNLFLVSGLSKVVHGSFSLYKSGGLYDRFPVVAILFVISAFSLAGVPPLSGFWGKYILARAGLDIQQYAIVAISLAVGLLTLFSMSKIWKNVFWSRPPESEKSDAPPAAPASDRDLFRSNRLMIVSSAFLALFTLFLSFYAEFMIDFSTMAAEQLLNPKGYIDAVLNR